MPFMLTSMHSGPMFSETDMAGPNLLENMQRHSTVGSSHVPDLGERYKLVRDAFGADLWPAQKVKHK